MNIMTNAAIVDTSNSTLDRPITQAFGELDLAFIDGSKMTKAWWDKESGGDHNGAFYNPSPDALGSGKDGFYFLGSLGVNSYKTPNDPILLVRASAGAPTGKPPLKLAEDFIPIWNDKGSGAQTNGSFWLPTCTDSDYVALGTYCVKGHAKPDLDETRVVLVRKDLTRAGAISAFIWNDKGTGSKHKFGAWTITVAGLLVDSTRMLIAPGCFVGASSRDRPGSAAQANVLLVNVPTLKEDNPFVPKLTSPVQPPQFTAPDLVDTIIVPYTAIIDAGLSVQEQIKESPFYTINRTEVWDRAAFQSNATGETQEFGVSEMTGVSTSASETFSVSTGVSVTVEAGVKFLGTGGKASGTVSVELGYQTSTHIEEFVNQTISNVYTVSPQSAFAVWTKYDQLTVRRMDGVPVSSSLAFRENVWAVSSYPLG